MAASPSVQLSETLPPLPPYQQSVIDMEESQRDILECESVKKHLELGKTWEYRRRKAAAGAEAQKKRRLYWFSLTKMGQDSRFDSVRVREAIDKEYGDSAAVLPQCYEEIKKLLKIGKSPICKKALEEWSWKEALFFDRVQRAKAEVANLKTEIYQIVTFQGFLLTGVTGSNLLQCNNCWSPVLLSVLFSLVSIAGIFLKTKQIDDIEVVRCSEEQSLKEVTARLNTLRSKGVEEFEFAKFHEFSTRDESMVSKSELFVYYTVVGCLLIFTVAFPLSFWRISCYPGANPYVG